MRNPLSSTSFLLFTPLTRHLSGCLSGNWVSSQFVPIFLCTFCFFLSGCQNNPGISAQPSSSAPSKASDTTTLIHIDSTRYVNGNTSSVSMRASILEEITANNDPKKPLLIQPLAVGYKIQFRSITTEPALVSNVAIIAGGKNFFYE